MEREAPGQKVTLYLWEIEWGKNLEKPGLVKNELASSISLQEFFDFSLSVGAGYHSPSICRSSKGNKQLFHWLSVFIIRNLKT